MAVQPAYQFASKAYSNLFPSRAASDQRWGAAAELRGNCLDYLKAFDKQDWYNRPIVTILNGQKLTGGDKINTVDAFGAENGSQIMSTDAQAEAVLHHIHNYKPPKTNYLAEFERIDTAIMLQPHAAFLMGNQMIDYRKQDGVTEVIESQGSNEVERAINRALIADEAAGKVHIVRWPAFIGCVSNFSNFLDLSRKVMRNLECGVPVVVLSRNNTTQHMFRWSELLLDLMTKEGVDPGMLTYFSCTRQQKNKVFKASPECPAYFTCSRDVAAAVKKDLPKIMSSTGGPNTLVAPKLTPEISTAIRLSGMIENKGQCTAMRHFVLPDCTDKTVDDIFKSTPVVSTPLKALEDSIFAGIFDKVNDRKLMPGYKQLPSQPAIHFRLADTPPAHIDECWREPVIDVTAPMSKDFKTQTFVNKLSHWLNKEQPISLAINGDHDLAMELFERTGLVVYSVGTLEKPALTAQARPEDGECFGEFPPRAQLEEFTHLPVIIPSATAGYNTYYTQENLAQTAKAAYPPGLEYCNDAFVGCSVPVHGFVKQLCNYLADACGPKRGVGHGGRTPIYGLQRPPIMENYPTVLRIAAGATLDEAFPVIAPFFVTNARAQLQVSLDPSSSIAQHVERFAGMQIIKEDTATFQRRLTTLTPYNVMTIEGKRRLEPLLAMHWISRIFCFGHIKSAAPEDEAFVQKFTKSKKWLAIAPAPSRL